MLCFASALPAQAAPAFAGSSRAYGLRSDLAVAGLGLVNPAPAGLAQGEAPPSYSSQQAAVPLNVNVSQLLVIDLLKATGTITSSATSDIGTAAAVKTTAASSTVENLELSVGSLLSILPATPPIVAIEATAVQGNTVITGSSSGLLGLSGQTQLTGLKLKVLNVPVTLTVGDNPPPNTEIDLALAGLAGARLILNEQTVTGDGAGRITVVSNALSLKFNAVALGSLGLLNGTVEVGHHEAQVTVDLDNDGTIDENDPDDDGDGLPDTTEGGGTIDSDNDGLPDSRDTDSDNDSIPDQIEGATDPDGDGRGNFVDLDSDGDGIADALEGVGTPDADGVPNFLDLDSDGDGINDVRENGGSDLDGDGLRDGHIDTNNDGISDTVPAPPTLRDSDADLAPDFLDLDSDNDSLSDLQEGGAMGVDANNDGILDDPDGDGDGITNGADGKTGFGDANDAAPRNTDSTDTPDYIDPDSDNSGSPDIASAGNASLDANGDGRVDSIADPDGDGIAQLVDSKPNASGGLAALLTFQQWQAANFTPAELLNPAICGPNADPDGDGLANLLEFTFGTLPKNPASNAAPLVQVGTSPGGRTIELTVPKAPGIYAFVGVEVSTQLEQPGQWSYRPDLVVIASESGTSLVSRCTIDPVQMPRLFVRVRSRIP